MRRERNSVLWEYWTKNCGGKTAKCRVCKKDLSYKTTIANLKNHLRLRHNETYKEYLSKHELQEMSGAGERRSSNAGVYMKPDDEEEEEEETAEPETVKTSDILNYFETDDDGSTKCLLCKSEVDSNYSDLKSHLMDHHPNTLLKIAQDQSDDEPQNEETYSEIVYLNQDSSRSKSSEKSRSKKKSPTTRNVIRKRERSFDFEPSFETHKRKREEDIESEPKRKPDDSNPELEIFISYIKCLLKKLPQDLFPKVQLDIINSILNAPVKYATTSNMLFSNSLSNNSIMSPQMITTNSAIGNSSRIIASGLGNKEVILNDNNLNVSQNNEVPNSSYTITVVTENELK